MLSAHAQVSDVRRQAADRRDLRSLRLMLFRYLGFSLIAATAFWAMVLSVPIYMQGMDPIALASRALGQIEGAPAPMFASDDRFLLIEPAGGPLSPAEMTICRQALAEEMICRP